MLTMLKKNLIVSSNSMVEMPMSNSWKILSVPLAVSQLHKGARNARKNGIVRENASLRDGKITRRYVPW